MNDYILVANGVIDDYPLTRQIITRQKAHLIAVDGGLRHLDAMELNPDMIIGDLDSLSPELLDAYEGITIKSYPTDKDETDLELAVEEAIDLGAENILLLGALGGRCDHHLATLYLMARHPELINCETEQEEIFIITQNSILEVERGQRISLLPLGSPVSRVKTSGLKWELDGCELNSDFLSVSNVCVADSVNIFLEEGTLLCTLEKLTS
ncbi:MAG: thiamine diphosphokinase [Chlamydiales bacterium]|nr:thiamine diphosphokinase [Chlamydiia bacterium]MCP5508534.1 thiamine diphosphokinase [Chlamydiales bacterium]